MEGLHVAPWAGSGPFDAEMAYAEFRRANLPHYEWGNAPGDRYAEHTHAYEKMLVCLDGSIRFHVPGQPDLELRRGDRLVLPPGTRHAATVGPQGVRCLEAHGA